ncbi:Oxygen sensor histidine kinase NreB [bacterium HR18]|nr:Oxygen sensor histidine kinase NreB [bacterium HR18]
MPRRRAQKNHFWLDPAGIALLYLGASLLWIFFSDSLLLRAGLDPETLTRWQSTKGAAFVTVSALVLYVLMRAGQQLLRTQAQQLEASEAQYRLLFENNPRPMWIYDLETLRFLAVNQAAVALYGYREEEFLGMTILDIRPEEDRPRVAASAWAPRGPLKHSGPWRHLTKDGRMLEVEIDSHMLTWKGRRAVLVLVQDVTERNRIARENARYRQGLEILLELSRRLQQELMDCDRLAQQLVQTVRQVIPSADAALLWLRRGGRFVLVAKADGPEALPLGYTLPASGELLERLQAEEALAPAEVARMQAEAAAVLQGLQAALVAPIRLEGRLEGIICADSFTRVDAFAPYEHTLLRSLAAQAAAALQNARLVSQLRDLSRRLLLAHEEERRRIARELHDEVGALLTSVQLCLGMAQAATPPEATTLAENLREARQLIDRLSQEIRQLTLQLRPPLLDELGLAGALRAYAERFERQTRIAVRLALALPERTSLPELIELTAYRFVQEALTNVARHARVDQVDVKASLTENHLHLVVQDQGIGFDPETVTASGRSMGLVAMRERIELLGGRLEIESHPQQGTRLEAYLPLPAETNPFAEAELLS